MSTRKNAMYNVAYRVFSVLLPLVTAPYLSRVVGQDGVGLYSYAWSISYVFVLIGMLGLNDYGVRAIAKVRDHQDDLNRTFSEIWRMQLAVAAVTLAVYIGYVVFIAGEERYIALHLTLMSVSCLINLDWCMMGLDQFKPIALRNTFVKLAGMACIFLFVRCKEDLWIYGLVWSLATCLGCISCWSSLRGKVRIVPVTWADAMKHLRPCAVLFISVMAVNVYRTMDKIMVGAIAGMEMNGLYDNAEKIIYCLSGFISAIGTVMLPKIAHLQERGETARIRKHIDLSMQLILCMTSAMAFGVAAVARPFAPLFYGDSFAYSGELMIPLAFTLIMIGFANVIRTQWVLPQSRDHIFVISVISGAVVNLIANGLMIPSLGAMGAVAATLMAEFTVPFVQWIILRKELPYGRYLGYVVAYAAIGTIMLLILRQLQSLLPLTGWLLIAVEAVVGAVIYAVLCLLLWTITKNKAVLSLLKRSHRAS